MRARSLLLVALVVLTTPAAAQRRGRRPAGPPRVFLGGDVVFAQPTGDFADHVDRAFGGEGHLLYRPSAASPLALRLDGGYLQYGHESRELPLSSDIGGRIRVDEVTDNYIAYAGVGPQVGVPDGRLQPYVNASVGVAYFGTDSYLRGTHESSEFARTSNFSDTRLAWRAGAGLYVPLTHGRVPVSLDLGARYHYNGVVDYLREGGIHDEPDGSISFTPIHGQANFFTFQAGVTVGLRHSRGEHRRGGWGRRR
ncbi:MAG TPA: hypothetical protein VFL93_08140 [Longimicrobiaceae bacterium]|nr:hypothetical protein [Longimicrobiaceae bacterium]